MDKDLTLGVDFGTSAVKGVVMDGSGHILAHASAAYPMYKPSADHAEQNAEDWWLAFLSVCRDLTAAIPCDRLAAVGLSGQLNGVVLMGEDGEVLRPAMIWLDQRCKAEVGELKATFQSRFADITGNPASPIAILPKLRWLVRHEQEMMLCVKRILQVKDYILLRLTGACVTEPNEASATLMMDLETRDWSNELVAFAGISRDVLPVIAPSNRFAGHVLEEVSRLTGLPTGLPVVPGSGDTGALAVGCGAYEPGVLAVTLGTAGHVVAAVPNSPPGFIQGLWRMAHVSPDRELWLGLLPAGGLSIAWLRQVVAGFTGGDVTFVDLEALACQSEPGSRGVAFLPFLEGAGTPWNEPQARAAFSGLNSTHGAAEIVRAVYEGIAFNIRAAVEAFEASGVTVTRIHLSEGGARSEFWCQIIADVLGREVHVVEQGDTSATGAAILARSAIVETTLAELVQQCVRLGHCYNPSSAHSTAYEIGWNRFCEAALISQSKTGLQ